MSRPARQYALVRPASRTAAPDRARLAHAVRATRVRAVLCGCALPVLLGAGTTPALAQDTGAGSPTVAPDTTYVAGDGLAAAPAGGPAHATPGPAPVQHTPEPGADPRQREQDRGVAGEAGLTLALGAVLFAAAAGRRRGS